MHSMNGIIKPRQAFTTLTDIMHPTSLALENLLS